MGYNRKRKQGWNMNLYRNRRKGCIAGVCAGLAEHWEVPTWVVRLAAVALFFITGTMAFWAYIIGWVLMSPRPQPTTDRPEKNNRSAAHRPAPTERLRAAQERLDRALDKVDSMESYVTSRRYQLDREFAKL